MEGPSKRARRGRAICHAGRQSRRPGRAVSTRTDDGRTDGAHDVDQGSDLEPDDGPLRRRGVRPAAGDLREPGGLEHAERAAEGVRGRAPARPPCRPDRPRAGSRHGSRVLDGGVEHRARDPVPSRGLGHHETDDRPGRALVDRGEDPGRLEPLVRRARAQAHPADDAVAVVREQTGGRVITGAGRQLGAVGRGGRVRPVPAADAEVGAPAPLGVAALLEQRGEVAEAVRASAGRSRGQALRPSPDGSRGPAERCQVRLDQGSGVGVGVGSGVGSGVGVGGGFRRRVGRGLRGRRGGRIRASASGSGRRSRSAWRSRWPLPWRRRSRSASASSRPAGRSLPVAPCVPGAPGVPSPPFVPVGAVVSGAPVAAGSAGSVGVTPVGRRRTGPIRPRSHRVGLRRGWRPALPRHRRPASDRTRPARTRRRRTGPRTPRRCRPRWRSRTGARVGGS